MRTQRFPYFMTIFSVFFVITFVLMGNWQLHRYHYKKTLLAEYHTSQTQAPIPLKQALATQTPNYQMAKVDGHYLTDKTLFLANQLRSGISGYRVFAPFQPNNQKAWLLVDKGWVASPEEFQQSNLHATHAQGHLVLPEKHVFFLGPNILQNNSQRLIMQKVKLQTIGQTWQHPILPYLLRTQLPKFSVMPSRHMGYAVQWFAMAIVLAIAYIIFYRRQRD